MTEPTEPTELRGEPHDLEQRALEQLTAVGKALEKRPLVAVAIGVGIGILLARVLGD